MKRADIVLCALQGDYGKPRPVVIVQADLFNPTHASLTICPITSHCVETPLFRVPLLPRAENGLKVASEIMVDKITSIKRDKITQVIGTLTHTEQDALDTALNLWLDL